MKARKLFFHLKLISSTGAVIAHFNFKRQISHHLKRAPLVRLKLSLNDCLLENDVEIVFLHKITSRAFLYLYIFEYSEFYESYFGDLIAVLRLSKIKLQPT
jgi:hypothetical protein